MGGAARGPFIAPLALDRQPPALWPRQVRQRVAAIERGVVGACAIELDGDVLAGLDGRQRAAVLGSQRQRDDIWRLPALGLDPERAKSEPNRLIRIGEPAQVALELGAQIGRKRLVRDRRPQRGHVVARRPHVQAERRGHGRRRLARALEQDDRRTGPDLARTGDGQVPARPLGRDEAADDVVAAEADPELVARRARLADDEVGTADAQAVAEAQNVLAQSGHGQVLAESARPECRCRKLLAPERIVLGRIGVHRLGRSAVDGQVRLTVAGEAAGSKRDTAGDRLLEDGGADRAAPPLDVARLADADRNHSAHLQGEC